MKALKKALASLNIPVKNNKVKKSDIMEALKKAVAEDEEMGLDGLMEKLDIKEDGLKVFLDYAESHRLDGDDMSEAYEILSDFKSDVEEYAMPAVEKMLSEMPK